MYSRCFCLVLLAEYNVLDNQSETTAALGLVALSQALFLILSVRRAPVERVFYCDPWNTCVSVYQFAVSACARKTGGSWSTRSSSRY